MKQHVALTACVAAVCLTTPALAQTASDVPATPGTTSTSAPAPAGASPEPVAASPSVSVSAASASVSVSAATTSVQAPSLSVSVATASVLAASPSLSVPASLTEAPKAALEVMPVAARKMTTTETTVTETRSSGFTMPKLPFGLSVDVQFDGLGQGTLTGGGYVNVPTSNNGVAQNVPGLAQASPSVSVNGFSLGAEAHLPAVDVGVRYQRFGEPATAPATLVTPNPPGATQNSYTVPVFFPSSYGDLYARLGALKVGLRNETYPSTSNYTDLIAGLNFALFNVMDIVSLNVGALGGYGLVKPTGVTVPHIPFEGDVDVMVTLGLFQGRLGYRAAGAADADMGSLVTAFTSPSSLQGNTTLQQTQFGLYRGPYLSLGVNF